MAVAIQSSPIEIGKADEIEEQEMPISPKKKDGVKFSIGGGSPQRTTSRLQPTLMAPIKPITLTIFTIDNLPQKVEFKTGRHTIAGDIVKEMICRFNIPEEMTNVFSIWMVSKHLQLQLKSYHVPVKLFKKWKDFLTQYTNAGKDECQKDQPILSFKRNVFLPIKEEKRLIAKRNSKVALTLLYKEAVYNVVCGLYPFTNEEVIELAGYQCAIEKNEFDRLRHTPESLKDDLHHFFPMHMLPCVGGGVKTKLLGSVKGSVRGGSLLEVDLCNNYETVWNKVSSGVKTRKKDIDVEKSAVAVSLGHVEETKLWEDIDLQLKLLYLQRCWNKPYYGSVMFRGQVERKASNIKQLLVYSDRAVVVAINPECVHLFKEATETSPGEIMLYLTYDLLLWDFQPATEEGENFYSSLWLQFDSTLGRKKVAKRLQVFSRQAPMMDAMISRCVDDLNKLDEEVKKIRLQQDPSAIDAPSYSIPTGTTQSNSCTKNYLEDKLICETFDSTGEHVSIFPNLFNKKKQDTPLQPKGTNKNETTASTAL